jgi:tRNA (uracil-5-)-methyltransferase
MFSHIQPSQYPTQLAAKQQKIAELFADLSLPTFDIYQSVPINYRQRAEFRVWHDGDELNYIMFDQATKQKYTVTDFPVASNLINQAMSALLACIKTQPLLRYKLFQVDFLASQSGELLISLLYHKPLTEQWQQAATQLQQILPLSKPINIIGRAKKQKIIIGQDYVTETLSVMGKQYLYQQVENSFTQPNAGINEHMLTWAKQATASLTGDLIELYCGNGNFSVALADNFSRVLGTEISKSSVASAQHNITLNQIDNIDIIRMSSEEFSQAMNQERKFRRLEHFDLASYGYDTVLVDPPRAGLDADSVELTRRFQQILYISCNPHTLKQNLQQLITTHNIEKFALFDQFPFTEHVECGVFLSRK